MTQKEVAKFLEDRDLFDLLVFAQCLKAEVEDRNNTPTYRHATKAVLKRTIREIAEQATNRKS